MLFDVVNIREVVFIKQLVTVNEPTVTVTVFNCLLSFLEAQIQRCFHYIGWI